MRNSRTEHFLASELLRISRFSTEAAELIMPMIRDKNMELQVSHQLKTYRTIAEQCANILRKSGLNLAEKTGLMDWMLQQLIKMDTAWNQSDSHLARIVIHCTDAAMKNLMKAMNQTANDDLESHMLVEKYLDEGQKDIDFMEKYL